MFLKKTITLLSAAMLLATGAMAQQASDSANISLLYNIYTRIPRFPGGNDKLPDYFSKNIHYPDSARKAGIEGRVLVKFAIDTNGSISDAQIIRSVGYGLDEEALRLVNSMPRWKPGTEDGKPVKVYYTLPISFWLEGPPKKKN